MALKIFWRTGSELNDSVSKFFSLESFSFSFGSLGMQMRFGESCISSEEFSGIAELVAKVGCEWL